MPPAPAGRLKVPSARYDPGVAIAAEPSMSQTPDSEPRLQVPGRTTPTWEIELLISGALVFSMFSLRQPLEDYFTATFPLVTELLQPLVVYTYLYGKLTLFVLMITFVVHLAARARWVALVGVHSIYPAGPRWDNLSGGPVTRRLTRETVGQIDEAVERADNLASLVFGYGIVAAQLSLVIMVVSLILFSFIALLRLAGVPERFELWILGAFLLLMILPLAIDKYVLPRLAESHWLTRPTTWLVRASMELSLQRVQQPLASLITTNLGGKRGAWLLMLVVYGVLALVSLDTFQRLDRGHSLRGDALAGTERDFGLSPMHYAPYRTGALRLNVAPFIESEVVSGPYLKLTLPYQARRHDQLLARSCQEVPLESRPEDPTVPREAELARWQARANCFGRLFDIRLNGKPVPNLEFHRLQGVDDAVDGVVAMIDVRDLGPGRHTLQLAHLDEDFGKAESDADGSAGAGQLHVIEFWR